MFEVGQQVVCVNTKSRSALFPCPLIKGKIYTITWCDRVGEQVACKVAECILPADVAFDAARFRPINRRTDISQFQKILEQSKEKEQVE